MRTFAARNGYDVANHRSSLLSQGDIDWADVIVFMDKGNEKRLSHYQGVKGKAFSLGSFIGLQSIKDPNFTPEGAELNALLMVVIRASQQFAQTLLAQLR